MKLETFLKKIAKQKKKTDHLHIYAQERVNGHNLQFDVDDIFIKRHPLILKADLIKYGDYETNATDGINGQSFKIKLFYAEVDYDQYKIARDTKGQ